MDQNNNNVCDAGEPATTTDAQGNYSLPDTGNLAGQTLLVTVTSATKDLSRPAGYTFPASFTMAQIVTDAGQQHISPLSTLVTAQMQTGLSQAQATAAVTALLGGTDPNADYVATSDSATLAKAIAVVDKLTSFASGGVVDAATVRNALNAIVAKGDIASVTAADVQAQATKPVYAGANAADILAGKTYGFNSYSPYWADWNKQPARAFLQDVRSVVGGQLVTEQQEYVSGAWQAVVGNKYETVSGVYVMRPDASWSGFVPVSQYRAPLSVSVNGAKLKGVDGASGISYNYEYRVADLSGQPLTTAIPAASYAPDLQVNVTLQNQTFAQGTKAVVGLLSYDADQIVLPIWTVPCNDTQVTGAFTCGGAIPAVAEDGVTSIVTGDATTTYTSVQQAVGVGLVGRGGAFSMQLTADGQVQYFGWLSTNGGAPQKITYQGGTWSVYGRNSNVLVLEMNAAAIKALGTDPILAPVSDGAKLVVALRNGRLRLGWLYPATYAQKTYQFHGGLNQQLFSAVQAAVVP
ncbi:hypothetical protein [Cupriavidus basilensis]|uniref:hypothetical protein n=1 Tax=Cupriavidus basilensis TaxID=68895 RepID=UPI00157A3386|nr:hypothetical protein [Cupriavidus basilensis]